MSVDSATGLSVLNLWVESGVSGFQLMAVLLYLACDHMEIKVSTRAQNVASTMSKIAKAPISTNENWVAAVINRYLHQLASYQHRSVL
jgi:hypothetical protein